MVMSPAKIGNPGMRVFGGKWGRKWGDGQMSGEAASYNNINSQHLLHFYYGPDTVLRAS